IVVGLLIASSFYTVDLGRVAFLGALVCIDFSEGSGTEWADINALGQPRRLAGWTASPLHDYFALNVGYVSIRIVPGWLAVLIFATPTALLFWFDRRHVKPGHCAKCGYDLRGNESGICSECGKVTSHPRQQQQPRDNQ
ncbi:MAG: hypothetical protein AB7N71_13320, partial [Phycisphaerae bacterium]